MGARFGSGTHRFPTHTASPVPETTQKEMRRKRENSTAIRLPDANPHCRFGSPGDGRHTRRIRYNGGKSEPPRRWGYHERGNLMQVRFKCPACNGSHILDMPETTIHMTCSTTGKHLELRLGVGGEVRAKIIREGANETEAEAEAAEDES
jgi:hypothetical protein